MKKGTLYLIPNVIAAGTSHEVISPAVFTSIKHIKYFLAEDLRTVRRYFSELKIFNSIEELVFEKFDKDTAPIELFDLLKPLNNGEDVGIVSESGCPGIADPGAAAVSLAHEFGCKVKPLVGPSAILLALMGSGLNGQTFAFHGYLPVDEKALAASLKSLEQESLKKQQTQLFIETPYRNNRMFNNLLKFCKPSTQLCVAYDLTGAQEYIATKSIAKWKQAKLSLDKLPCVFAILAN
ncbi:MAG TPA: SAM-dependent methyltransferase [Cyclobacteriaceae bacterium]|nr:SAM-dependent methyltransferase [Cyclobacteriaceae bacterium]